MTSFLHYMEKPVDLLILFASPRRNGNSAYIAGCAAEFAQELPFKVNTHIETLAGKKIAPCCSCLACYKNGGNCVIKDSFETLRQAWIAADCILYVVPVYVVGIPGQLKSFLDRLHNSLIHHYPISSCRHMKPIGALTQGGDFGGGQELAALDIMRHAALINCMYTAPDGSYINSSGWADGPDGNELRRKVMQKSRDAELMMNTIRSTVTRVTQLAMIIREGTNICREYLCEDERYRPYLNAHQENL